MSDQASLPVTFPPGTELPVKGKVEVTNEVHVKVMNAEIPVTVVGEVPVKVTNTPKVEVSNTPHVEVTNVPEVKLAAASAVEVTKGKIEVTNTVKVEGVATSPIAVTNGAGAGEVSVNQKKLLVTEGFKKVIQKAAGEATKYLVTLPESPNAYFTLESLFFSWKEAKVKEKEKIYLKVEVEANGTITHKLIWLVGEIIGAGEKTMTFESTLAVGNNSTSTVINENNLWISFALPLIHGGLGVPMNVKASMLKASPVGTAITTEAKEYAAVLINNEGTL